ncbi:hypothetical protein [Motiliproteus sp. MSK22-1]|uniref:hypothetical protein n=1 Tax=Motiliproteus sp. MSK22-1 TaxID=1897630 RepID=UPI00117FBD87|nr:hypothetical protein [Motiliproteus sp. MSK22-1]
MRDRLSGRSELAGVDVKPVKLLSEIPVKLRQRKSSPAPGVTEQVGAELEQACFRIGDFSNKSAAVRFQQARLPDGVESSIRSVERNEPDYWVYVKSPEDLQQRQGLQAELRNSGLEVSLIKRGELKGELSLGRYSNKELAQALLSALLEQNHPAKIFEVSYKSSVFVIEVSHNGSRALSDSSIGELIATNPELKSEKKVCKGVASAEDPE